MTDLFNTSSNDRAGEKANHPLGNGSGVDQLDVASLGHAEAVRAWADGEIDTDAAKSLGIDTTPGSADHQSAAFERELRSSVERVMASAVAPASLRDRVKAAISARSEQDQDALAERMEARSEQTRSASFWQRNSRLVGAIAAVLVLGVVGVFLTSTLPTGGFGGPRSSSRTFTQDDRFAYRNTLASFVSAEHGRTAADNKAATRKFSQRTTDAAHSSLEGMFGRAVAIPDCVTSGLTFLGCGGCAVPGTDVSAHMQFRVPASGKGGVERTVSLFVGDADGALDLAEDTLYELDRKACDLGESRVYVWTSGDLMYCMVTQTDPEGRACRKLMDLMHAPTTIVSL